MKGAGSICPVRYEESFIAMWYSPNDIVMNAAQFCQPLERAFRGTPLDRLPQEDQREIRAHRKAVLDVHEIRQRQLTD